ncbi:MAG TPA: hypothetical protein VF622_12410, partial [Segetibacter sp.]
TELIYNHINKSERSYSLFELANSFLKSCDNKDQVFYCILNNKSPCGILWASITNNTAEVGCIISSKERGKKVGSISCSLFYTELLKLQPDILEFSAVASHKNLPSIKLMSCLGLSKQSISPSATLNNQWVTFKVKAGELISYK